MIPSSSKIDDKTNVESIEKKLYPKTIIIPVSRKVQQPVATIIRPAILNKNIKAIPLSNGVLYRIPSYKPRPSFTVPKLKPFKKTVSSEMIFRVPQHDSNNADDKTQIGDYKEYRSVGVDACNTKCCSKSTQTDVNMNTYDRINGMKNIIFDLGNDFKDLKQKYTQLCEEDYVRRQEITRLQKIIQHQNNYFQSLEAARSNLICNPLFLSNMKRFGQ